MPTKIGSYDLIQAIGNGPGGPVHLAVDTVLDRMVALKHVQVLDGKADDPRLAPMTEEVAQLSRIRAHCVGPVYACSKPHESTVYVAREYIAGIDLGTLLHNHANLDKNLAVSILWGITTGLAGFHQEGQAHGNLKLTNVFLRQSGGVKVVDPLVNALATTASGGQREYTSGWFGSPSLLAPEQREGAPPTLATDSYALGCIAYRLMTGQLYDDPSIPAQSAEPSITDPTVPANIGGRIAQCLNRDPDARVGAINNLRIELTEWLQDAGLTPKQAMSQAIQSVSSLFLMANLNATTSSTRVDDGHERLITHAPKSAVEHQPTAEAASYELDTEDTPFVQKESEPEIAPEPPSWSSLRDDTADEHPTPPPLMDVPGSTVTPPEKRTFEPPRFDGIRTLGETLWESPFARIIGAIAAVGLIVFFLLPVNDPVTPNAGVESAEVPLSSSPTPPNSPSKEPKNEVLAQARTTAYAQPTDGEARLLLAQTYFDAEKPLPALEESKVADQLLPNSPRPSRLTLRILLHLKRGPEAIIKARAAIKKHAADANLHLLLARALLNQGRNNDASDALETAVQMNASLGEAWLELGHLHLAANRPEKAHLAYERALSEEPNSTAASIGLGRSLLRLGRSSSAVDALVKGLEGADTDPQLEYTVGRVLLFGNRFDEAAKHLNRYRETHPDDWRGLFSLGLLRLRQGRSQEALAFFEQVQTSDNSRAELSYNRGLAQLHEGKLRDAIQSWSSAVSQRHTCWEALCERAKAYHRLGNLTKAREGYEQTMRLHPTSVVARSMLETRLDSTTARLQLGLPCQPRIGLDISDE